MNLELWRQTEDGDSNMGIISPQMVLPATGLDVEKITVLIFQIGKPRLRTVKCGTHCGQGQFLMLFFL